jgi:hypothetical protein
MEVSNRALPAPALIFAAGTRAARKYFGFLPPPELVRVSVAMYNGVVI